MGFLTTAAQCAQCFSGLTSNVPLGVPNLSPSTFYIFTFRHESFNRGPSLAIAKSLRQAYNEIEQNHTPHGLTTERCVLKVPARAPRTIGSIVSLPAQVKNLSGHFCSIEVWLKCVTQCLLCDNWIPDTKALSIRLSTLFPARRTCESF